MIGRCQRLGMAFNPRPSVPRIRLRAVLLGMGLVAPLCWWALYNELISAGTELIEASLVFLAILVLFVLVLANHLVLKLRSRPLFTRAEILFVYIVLAASLGIAGMGGMQFLNQAVAGGYYFAPPGNRWARFFKYIPRGWTPNRAVIASFYSGGSTFWTEQHVLGWLAPICMWSGFIVTMLCCFLCVNTMLRRHWVEHERLAFPLVSIPLELTRTEGGPPVLQSQSFWIAVLLACGFRCIAGLHQLLPIVPAFPSTVTYGEHVDLAPYFSSPPLNAVGYFQLSFHPMVIGVTYFLPLDVSFSAWFFYLVIKAEQVAAAAWGYVGQMTPSGGTAPFTGEQGAGAFLALALFALWGARRHLRDVWRKAFTGDPSVSDADEPMSYRTAVLGFLASFSALVAFATAGGLVWYGAVTFFVLYLLMITAITRLRAVAGPLLNWGPDVNPHELMVTLPGSSAWSARSLTVLSYFFWFDTDFRTVSMPSQMEGFKIAESAGTPMRAVSAGILAAGAIAAVGSFVAVLCIYYHYGAITTNVCNDWRRQNGELPFTTLAHWVDSPLRPDVTRMLWVGAGFLVVAALSLLRGRYPWWPLHPAGFVLAHAGLSMWYVWFPMLMGWAVKAVILRVGGVKLFRRCVPFFIGLVIGDVLISCLFAIAGVAFHTQTYFFFP